MYLSILYFICSNLWIFFTIVPVQKSQFSNDTVELIPTLTGSHLFNMAPSVKSPIAANLNVTESLSVLSRLLFHRLHLH